MILLLNSRVESRVFEVLKRFLKKADPEFKDKAYETFWKIAARKGVFEELAKELSESEEK